MKTYLAIFTGKPSAMETWKALPPQELAKRQAEGVKAWHAWVERHRASIVDLGAPLGRTKRISAAGITDVRNEMTAYTVVRAESHAEAAKMFENHPHFAIFPGEAIEVMECMPIPAKP